MNTNPSFVQLESFSGPLDLLLELVRKQEMDILQIDIHKITHQYIEYLKQVPQPDVEKAGDFIRWASWLLYIKSKSLLPKEEGEELEPSAEELKNKLVHLLAVYQKFQKLGQMLYQRELLGRDCWKSSHNLILKSPEEEKKIEIDKEKAGFQLIQFYQKSLLDRQTKENYKIRKPIPSLLHRLKQTAELFTTGARLKFSQLVLFHKEKYSGLLSFLSLLELSKAGFVSLFQKHLFANIEITVKKPITKENLKDISPEEEENFESENTLLKEKPASIKLA